MIIAGIGGGLAALCGLFLVGYSLLVDRPEQDPKPTEVASNVAGEVHHTSGAPEVAPDASAGSEIEFLPMAVERSKTRTRSVGRSSRHHRASAHKPHRRTEEEKRLLKLYRKSGGPAAAAPAIDTKAARRRRAARQIKPVELLALQRKNKASLKACYERALKRDESLSELKAEVTVTIGDSGIVRRVSIRAGNNPELTSCIRRSIRRWAFPAIGAQSFSFPIIFRGS
jgi:hypothetical protein